MEIRLKQARKMKGLSLREAAKGLTENGLKLSHQGLNKYEKGLIGCDSWTLISFAKYYGVTTDYLVGANKPVVEFGEIKCHKIRLPH